MSVIIRLQLLPLSANAADVRAFFNGLRIPDGAVHIVGGDDGDAFIGFATDEDARQAMRRDRGQIHGQEVRLYLSSRAEMNDVITRAKAAVLGLRVPSPTISVSQQQEQIPSWDESAHIQQHYVTSEITNQPTKPSSFAPDPAEFNKPLYMRGPPQQQSLAQHQHTLPPSHAAIERVQNGDYAMKQQSYSSDGESYPMANRISSTNYRSMQMRDEFVHEKKFPMSETKMYQHDIPSSYRQDEHYGNLSEQRLYDSTPRFFRAPPSRNSAANMSRPTPTGMTKPTRVVPPQQYLADDRHSTGSVRDGGQLPPHLRPPYGIPPAQLRGSSHLPTPPNRSAEISETSDYSASHQERYNGPVALQNEDHRKSPGGPRVVIPSSDGRNRPNGGHSVPPVKQNQHQVSSSRPFSSGVNSWRSDNRPPPSTNGSSSWDANVQKNDLRSSTNTVPPHRKPLLSKAPQSYNNEKSSVAPSESTDSRPLVPPRLPLGSSASQSSTNRTPLLGPNFGAGPNVPRASPSGPRYIELSRLPSEMLRPAVLEQFLKPSVPLQVSSVKVVYSSQGIHMNTLVRFENASDADAVVKRDGELGIRVRPSTKVAFDEAVDGLPSGVVASSEAAVDNSDRKRDLEPSRRRPPSRSRERRKGKHDSCPRKRQRSQSRSRDRRGVRRSRSRSLKRSRQTTSSTRWCLQLTNVPFRCTEAEIIDWLSERVRPSKVTRTFYADGNASDRWIAEFESESLMERAQGIKRLLMGRTVKMCHIENDHADELMKIEDIYGERRKEDNEKMMNEVSHFNPPPLRGRGGGPVFFPAPARGLTSFGRGSHRGSVMKSSGGSAPGMLGRGMGRGFSSLPHEGGSRGRGRGAFGGRGGVYARENQLRLRSDRDSMENLVESHQSDMGAPRSPEPEPVAATDDFVASLGPRGTVISCGGFPSNVTMEDVLSFFRGFPVDHNSVRIRMGDDGIPTGECMLAMTNTEAANKAVLSLSGNSLRGQVVSLQLANP